MNMRMTRSLSGEIVPAGEKRHHDRVESHREFADCDDEEDEEDEEVSEDA